MLALLKSVETKMLVFMLNSMKITNIIGCEL